MTACRQPQAMKLKFYRKLDVEDDGKLFVRLLRLFNSDMQSGISAAGPVWCSVTEFMFQSILLEYLCFLPQFRSKQCSSSVIIFSSGRKH